MGERGAGVGGSPFWGVPPTRGGGVQPQASGPGSVAVGVLLGGGGGRQPPARLVNWGGNGRVGGFSPIFLAGQRAEEQDELRSPWEPCRQGCRRGWGYRQGCRGDAG